MMFPELNILTTILSILVKMLLMTFLIVLVINCVDILYIKACIVFKAVILIDQIEKMYFLGVLCLLLAAEALPTPEQLQSNVPDLPSPLELKPDEKDRIEEVLVDPVPPVVEEPSNLDKEIEEKVDEAKKELEAVEKAKEEEREETEVEKEIEKEVKDKFEDVVVVESNDPKDKPNVEGPKEEKKDEEVEEGPIIVEIFKPKPFFADFFSQLFPSFQWPHFSLPEFLRPRSADPLELDDPVYIVKESDFSWPYKK